MTIFKFFGQDKRRLFYLMPVIALCSALFFMHACKKEHSHQFENASKDLQKAGARDGGFVVTKAWLTDFQSDLGKVLDEDLPSDSYTAEEAAAGVEALINIASLSDRFASVHIFNVTRFEVDMTDNAEAIAKIYNASYDAYHGFWLTTDTANTVPVMVDVTVEREIGSMANIKVTSVLGVCNTCYDEKYANSSSPCEDVFTSDEAFRVGAGDEDMTMMDFFFNPPCEEACGSTPACGTGLTAYEQIEERINYNYLQNNPPTCPPGKKFVGWANVECVEAWPLDFIFETCNFNSQVIGTCMEYEQLNCVYCAVYDRIGTDPFTIPAGKHFVSINFALDYCVCGGDDPCDYLTQLQATYCYGTPVCRWRIIKTWDNPVAVPINDISLP
ncbi:MAG: hypothetical protein SFV22_17470 [Saprospiraceae bacterium]|nr:hypothetical protein [Saprospiraceae bacterium]